MKVALASVLAYRPSLIVLDEPFSGLDPLVRDELIEGLLERAPETTILLSSHDLAEIESFATHVGYLERGRLLFSDEMATLADRFREIEITLSRAHHRSRPTCPPPGSSPKPPATSSASSTPASTPTTPPARSPKSSPRSTTSRSTPCRCAPSSSPRQSRPQALQQHPRSRSGQGDGSMNQIITIFKKDARHLWPEILVSLVLTAALVRIYPYTWAPRDYISIPLQQVAVALLFLVPMSWWILITRLIQSESLVGDRQFWLTRPYEWKKLLAAKAPLPPGLPLPPHLHCTLPAHLRSRLPPPRIHTRSPLQPGPDNRNHRSPFHRHRHRHRQLRKDDPYHPWHSHRHAWSLHSGHAAPHPTHPRPIAAAISHLSSPSAIFLTVILIQYAKRRLWIPRTILACVVLLAIVAVLIPTDDHSIDKAYPQAATSQLPVQLTFALDGTHKVRLSGYD